MDITREEAVNNLTRNMAIKRRTNMTKMQFKEMELMYLKQIAESLVIIADTVVKFSKVSMEQANISSEQTSKLNVLLDNWNSQYMEKHVGSNDVIEHNSALDVMAKIKKYAEKAKKIGVGDEITNDEITCIVTKVVSDDYVNVIYEGGGVGYIDPQKYHKTGRHFSWITDC